MEGDQNPVFFARRDNRRALTAAGEGDRERRNHEICENDRLIRGTLSSLADD
jgi:hypothetical protein